MNSPGHNVHRWRFAALLSGVMPFALHGATAEVPVALDYLIVEQALVEQLFSGPGQSAEMFADASRCNTLVLSNPRVTGGEDEQMLLITDMDASIGTPLAGKCRFSRSWRGLVETTQSAHLEAGGPAISFRIVDSRLLRSEEGEDILPQFMQHWLRDYVYPRLASVVVDLGPAIRGVDELLAMVTAGEPAAVSLAGVRASPEALVATLGIEVADPPPGWAPREEPPLSDAELATWEANWQAWDAFATWMIKTLAETAGPELTRALRDTLLEARYELRDALAADQRARDPVRELFLHTWARLAPLLHDRDLPVPGGQALQFAAFVSAGDALQALDDLAPHLGMTISQDALRSLARTLSPAVTDSELAYATAVDPELRALLGLGAPLPETESTPESDEGLPGWLLNRLITSAQAAQIDPRLVQRLNTWVPRRLEIDNYLQAMSRLLDAISDAEHGNGKVPEQFLGIYDPLLRATAWQESCWRQYVVRDGEMQPIRSPSGSVGLMQINMHVWRGVYDVDQIQSNVGYNARAGNEILVHYLVDYAIRKDEHGVTGNPDNLARAAYAMYNGGPGHMKRYRQEKTSAYLKKIDGAFLVKYEAIQQHGPPAVKPCLAGG